MRATSMIKAQRAYRRRGLFAAALICASGCITSSQHDSPAEAPERTQIDSPTEPQLAAASAELAQDLEGFESKRELLEHFDVAQPLDVEVEVADEEGQPETVAFRFESAEAFAACLRHEDDDDKPAYGCTAPKRVGNVLQLYSAAEAAVDGCATGCCQMRPGPKGEANQASLVLQKICFTPAPGRLQLVKSLKFKWKF